MIATARRCGALAVLVWLPFAVAAATDSEALCRSISYRLSSVSFEDCLNSGFASGATSVRGLPLVYRDLRHPTSSKPGLAHAPRPPRIMLIGGIHGDELASVSIIFRWMPTILGPEGRDVHWRIIPLANPDGMLNTPARRTNASGVDLNRNFNSSDWATKAIRYWEERTKRDPRRYPGPSAASEPETRWLQQQIAEFQPDAIISIHAPYGVLDFDGPRGMHPEHFGRLRLNRLGIYPGSLGNYSGVDRNTPVVTLEFASARSMPTKQELRQIWHDMMRWIRQNVPGRDDSGKHCPQCTHSLSSSSSSSSAPGYRLSTGPSR